jgi:hypothetical protein
VRRKTLRADPEDRIEPKAVFRLFFQRIGGGLGRPFDPGAIGFRK